MRWTAAPKTVPLCAQLGLPKAFQDLASDNYPGKNKQQHIVQTIASFRSECTPFYNRNSPLFKNLNQDNPIE